MEFGSRLIEIHLIFNIHGEWKWYPISQGVNLRIGRKRYVIKMKEGVEKRLTKDLKLVGADFEVQKL